MLQKAPGKLTSSSLAYSYDNAINGVPLRATNVSPLKVPFEVSRSPIFEPPVHIPSLYPLQTITPSYLWVNEVILVVLSRSIATTPLPLIAPRVSTGVEVLGLRSPIPRPTSKEMAITAVATAINAMRGFVFRLLWFWVRDERSPRLLGGKDVSVGYPPSVHCYLVYSQPVRAASDL
ncbi:hypothetical protein DSL72_001665 [Monilinia vaccinii-corymbosi]|uniref:Uncharacterized protein n=1 Tax=Monilinia vaccinii-corymbosi TaxID=61207 RepID=A0A8A3P7Q6_9HELO|nr:hypothetical protein DSL72_001665 [Monilinia vaccinii-corymbosi]